MSETILQFGGGRFLRAFVDLFVQQANDAGQNVGQIVVIQSTGGERANLLNEQQGRYHVLVRGREAGQAVERLESVQSISRALVAQSEWTAVLEAACSPHLRWIVSNTTEKGLALDPADDTEQSPPLSFPARILALLKARFQAGLPGLILLPCELVDNNGDLLLSLVLEQAERWHEPEAFRDWLRSENLWANTLVDRIVTGTPQNHPLLAEDPLLIAAEPFAFWGIEAKSERVCLFEHPAITLTPDVRPYALRKVRILNGAHTSLVCKAVPKGFTTVREAVEDPEIGDWLRGLLFEEIVPTMEGRVEDAEKFAGQVLERFANPFLEHKLSDIALYHETKIKVRLVPTFEEYQAKFGKLPARLSEILSHGVTSA